LRAGHGLERILLGPFDVFGSGKVLSSARSSTKDGSPYSADIRGVLKPVPEQQYKDEGYTLNAANEIEVSYFTRGRRAALYETQKF